jgi:hypothetical protein
VTSNSNAVTGELQDQKLEIFAVVSDSDDNGDDAGGDGGGGDDDVEMHCTIKASEVLFFFHLPVFSFHSSF